MQFVDAVEQLLPSVNPSVREGLRRLHQQERFLGVIPSDLVFRLANSLGGGVMELLPQLVPFAALRAVPLISKYHVGAVALGASGCIYYGANLEIPGESLGFTVHGEQSAVANAGNSGEHAIRAIALSAAPCGHCRQFLYELANAGSLQILIRDRAPISLGTLLPGAFGPADLNVAGRLLACERHRLAVNGPVDPLLQLALDAANSSYAPYTRSYSGSVLVTEAGHMYTGRYMENAAFNPSLSPVSAAISQAALAGESLPVFSRAVLVEHASAPVTHHGTGSIMLQRFGGAKLERHLASESSR